MRLEPTASIEPEVGLSVSFDCDGQNARAVLRVIYIDEP
jgi:hypothetical protein